MLALDFAILRDLCDLYHLGTDAVDLGVGDPANVAVAQHRFEQALRVSDTA